MNDYENPFSTESLAMKCADTIREDCGGTCNNMDPDDLNWMIMEYSEDFGEYSPEFAKLVLEYLNPRYDDYEGIGLYASMELASSMVNFPEMEEILEREITDNEKNILDDYLKVLLRKSPSDYENILVDFLSRTFKVPRSVAINLFNVGFSRYKGLKKIPGEKKSFLGKLFLSNEAVKSSVELTDMKDSEFALVKGSETEIKNFENKLQSLHIWYDGPVSDKSDNALRLGLFSYISLKDADSKFEEDSGWFYILIRKVSLPYLKEYIKN